jgi:diaminopimelate epimerase
MENPHLPPASGAARAQDARHAAPPAGPHAVPHDYCKYHGLGNDYVVLDPAGFREPPTPEQVRAICDRHRGIGGDGVLLGPLRPGHPWRPPDLADDVPALRIFNPDGSEGEKSGNGLRIFARYLWERGHVARSPFSVHTPGGVVRVRVLNADGSRIAIEMGQVVFSSARIPMTGPPREVLREALRIEGSEYTISAANIGNPHCVVLSDAPTPELARRVGPLIERHPSFPRRTNVQFMQVLERHAIRIEIWERGAGYTLASGTSSCACAAVACRLGLCESPVRVHMPGGVLEIRVDPSFQVEMEGDVSAVSCGRFADEFLTALGLTRA